MSGFWRRAPAAHGAIGVHGAHGAIGAHGACV